MLGGKGINVSGVLAQLGCPSVALGFVAGETGAWLERGLAAQGLHTDFVHLENGMTRINVKIKAGQETELNGAGPDIPDEALHQLEEKLDGLTENDVLILAGSIPASLPQDVYERLLARLDRMLADAVDGSFRESRFDESRLSALEGRLARFLNGSAASARELEGKRAAIQTLISDISHQTKTPIANILLYASLLAEGELSPEQAAQAATLSRQAEKLSFLIQALVKASRLETGIITTAPEPQPVGPLLEGALAQARPQAEAKGLTLAAEPCGAAARFDRKWTAEALFNVVDNAVKYTPAGGRVTLSAVPLGQFCRVDVSDTGIGIPEEEQGRIFGRFYRGGAVRAEEGVGIGLYLVREILRRQGGYVKVASRPGQGTTFSLYLPRE